MKKVTILIIIIWSTNVFAQNNDAQQFYDLLKPKTLSVVPENVNSAVKPFFVVYKKWLSQQDNQHCGFTPSCSEYCLLSVAKNGFFYGYVDTFDRLTRCNGINSGQYSVDKKTHLLIDFPEKKNKK